MLRILSALIIIGGFRISHDLQGGRFRSKLQTLMHHDVRLPTIDFELRGITLIAIFSTAWIPESAVYFYIIYWCIHQANV